MNLPQLRAHLAHAAAGLLGGLCALPAATAVLRWAAGGAVLP